MNGRLSDFCMVVSAYCCFDGMPSARRHGWCAHLCRFLRRGCFRNALSTTKGSQRRISLTLMLFQVCQPLLQLLYLVEQGLVRRFLSRRGGRRLRKKGAGSEQKYENGE